MTFSERGRKRETESESGRVREKNWRKKKMAHSLSIQYSFFPLQPLFLWKPYHRERDGEDYRCIEEGKNTTGLVHR